MRWVKTNSKQLLVLVLSAACAVVLHYHPEWRDVIIAVGAALAGFGIHLGPIAYGGKTKIPPPLPLFLILLGCGVSPAAHTANVAEGVQQQAELTECRAKAREAKKDGGAIAYVEAYEACATLSDIKHGLKEGGP